MFRGATAISAPGSLIRIARRFGSVLAVLVLTIAVSVAGAGSASAAGGDPVLTPVQGSPFSAGGAVYTVAFSPTADLLAVGLARSLVTYSVGDSGQLTDQHTSKPPHFSPSSVAFSPNGSLMAVASAYGAVFMFTVNSDGSVTSIGSTAVGSYPNSVAFSPDGSLLAVGDYTDAGGVWMYTVGGNGSLTTVTGSPFKAGSETYSVAFGRNGDLLAAANLSSGSVSLFAVGSGGALSAKQTLSVPSVESVAFSPTADLLAVAGGSVGMYAPNGSGQWSRVGQPASVSGSNGVAINPSGTLLAVTSASQASVSVFTIGSDGTLQRVPASPFTTGGWSYGAAFSRDGSLLATGNADAHSVSVFQVGKVQQTITFTSSAPDDATIGQWYTPAADASSGLPVTLSVDKSAAGVCSLRDDGTVMFTGAGTCVVDANQAGDDTWQAAPQVQQSFTVSKKSQEVVFTSTAPKNAVVGGSYTATAMAQSSLPVTLSIDKTATGVCSLGDAGKVSFIGAGTCVVDANQPGNDEWAPAKRVQQSFAVGKAAQTVSFTSTAPEGAVVGGTYTPTATATSGLPVTLSIDKSAADVCSLGDDGSVSFTGAGTCVVDANQAGNKDYLAAKQVQQLFDVTGSEPAIRVSGPGSFTVSKAGSLSFTVSGTPAPTVTESGDLPKGLSFTVNADGSASIAGTPKPGTAGSYPVTVTATNPVSEVSKKVTITVGRVPSTLTISGPDQATVGDSVTLSARVTGGDPPSGTVTFSVGTTELGTATLDSTGRASLSTSDLPVGTDSVTASYSGDGTFQPATAPPMTVTVAAGSTTTSPSPTTTSPSPTTTATSSAAPTTTSPLPTTTATSSAAPPTTTASPSTSTIPPPTTTTVQPTLPNTGVPAGLLAACAMLLLGVGVSAVLVATRRRGRHIS